MGGIIGHDSFKGGNFDPNYPMAQGMLPLAGTSTIVATSDKDHGSAWFGGVSADVTYFEPFRELTPPTAAWIWEPANTRTRTSMPGWYAAFLAEYSWNPAPRPVVPGIPGDDANAYNGSERSPSIDPDVCDPTASTARTTAARPRRWLRHFRHVGCHGSCEGHLVYGRPLPRPARRVLSGHEQ